MDGLLISPGHVGLIGIAGSQNKPAFLGASGLWGFTASPTPQFAHFGRSTNKAGALASTRNFAAYNLAGTQLFPVNDPVVSAMTGLEGWSAVTNLLLNSDAPSSVADATLTANAAIAPDGTMTASKLGETATTAPHIAFDSAATVNGTTYNRSVFLKAAERTFAFVSLSATSRAVGVNLLTGAVVSTNGSPSNVLVEDAGNGWWRVSFSGTSGVPQNHNVYSSLDGVWANRSYAGETGKGILVWGNQVTLGTRLEPYVRTTSAAATRLADNTTIPQWQAFVERYSLLDGLTIDATANIRLTPSAARRILTIGTANDGFFLEQTTSNTIRAVLRVSSADVWAMTSGAIGAAGNRRVQVTLKPGANALTVEGVTGASNSNATALPDAIRTEPAYVGRDIAGSLHWNGNIPKLIIGKAAQ